MKRPGCLRHSESVRDERPGELSRSATALGSLILRSGSTLVLPEPTVTAGS